MVHPDEISLKLIEALSLDVNGITRLQITLQAGQWPLITVTHAVTELKEGTPDDLVAGLREVVSQYQLVPKKEADDGDETTRG